MIYPYKWQYNGADKFEVITRWCCKIFGEAGNNWRAEWETIYFVDKEDYLMFMLRWQ